MAESRLGDRLPAFWEAVGKDYYDDQLTLLALCSKHDLTVAEFQQARMAMGWTRRKTRKVSRKLLINRMFKLLDRSIKQLEVTMTTTGYQEVMVLNHLANTLGKLIDIEAGALKLAKPQKAREMHDIRNRLVQRIEELKRA
ncbi:MAG: hypothetical protein ABI697_12250 [Devosia sp.]